MVTIAFTRRLASAIKDLAHKAHAQEVVIEHRIEPTGEVVTVTERQRERRLLAEFHRPFGAAEWQSAQ